MNDFAPTQWQRAVLVAMYAIVCQHADPTKVWFTRRALQHILWFDWHGYHSMKAEQMVRYKWIEKGKTQQGSIVYRMTPAAHGSLSVDFGNAIAEVRLDVANDGQLKLL